MPPVDADDRRKILVSRTANRREHHRHIRQKLLKKIAEARSFKLKFIFPAARCTSGGSASAMTWLWARLSARFPIGTELIEFPAALRIAQNLVGLVNFLEFFLRRFFVFGDIRMILPREGAERPLDFLVGRLGRHSEDLIIIFEFNGHGERAWQPSDHSRSL